jgi:hypothetical protein
MINLKSEIQMKNFQKEEIQLSLNQTQSELDKLKRPINQIKFTNTSYMSTQFDNYKNRMNEIDKDINELFTNQHNNEISHQYKPFNQKERKKNPRR